MRFYFWIIFFIFCFIINVYAEIDMQIFPGFDGYHKHGCWLPLRITLTSFGENISGEIVSEIYVSDTDSNQIYSKSAEVFSVAKNIQYLYIFLEAYRRNLGVSFVDNNGRELLQKEAALKPLSSDERLILAVTDKASGLEFLAGITPNNYVSYANVESLPDSWKGYDSVDVIIFGDVSLSAFSDDQQQAIENWVYNGGTLIVSGGAYSQNLMGTFVEKLLPVSIKGTRILDSLKALSNHYGHDIGKAKIPLAYSEMVDEGEAVILESDNLPLIAKRRLGYGKTVFFAFDYLDPTIQSWEGKDEMWRDVLPEIIPREYPENRDISRILLATDYKGPLSYKWAGLFLLLYILCFLPLNYFVIKRTGKTMLIWLNMPAAGLIFAIFALGFNYNLRGQAVIINDFSVVDLYQKTDGGKVTSYFGLFSSANRDYSLNFPETVFIRNTPSRGTPGRDYKFFEDEIFKTKIFKGKIPSPVLFQGESYIKLDGKISLEIDEGLGGKVTNGLPFDLTECYVFSNGYRAYIGDLARNKTVNIDISGDVPVTQSKMGGEKQRFFNSMRQKLSKSITGKGIIGWADESALRKFLRMSMDVEYNTVGAMLVIIHI